MSVHPDHSGPFFYVLQEPVRILFVDDDPILREFAVVNLATEHAVIDTAPDGVAAMAAVEAVHPDILLLDLEMPLMDGFEVLAALRADERNSHLPVIVVTGREDVEAVDRAFQLGATSFVVKPLNWRLLSHQIRYVHRAAKTEIALSEGRDEVSLQLQRLAAESTRFIAQALSHTPELRPAAVTFAKAADAVLQPRPSAEAA